MCTSISLCRLTLLKILSYLYLLDYEMKTSFAFFSFISILCTYKQKNENLRLTFELFMLQNNKQVSFKILSFFFKVNESYKRNIMHKKFNYYLYNYWSCFPRWLL